MGRVIGATIKLDGEAKFKSAVSGCTKDLSLLKSETKLITTEFSGEANSLAALTKKQELLSKSYDVQKQKTDAVKSGLENAKKNYESVGRSLDEYKQKLASAQKTLTEMQSSGTATTEEVNAQKDSVKSLSDTVEKGEKTYTQAGNKVADWQKKLNFAKTEQINAGNAVKENNQYLYEAMTSTDKCATSIDKFGKQTSDAATEVKGFGESANKYFTSDIISQYADKASSAMSSLASSAYNSTKELDQGYDTIIKKTGATGSRLQSLKTITDSVFSSMPVEMTDVSTAVSDVNKRFDETGKQLESTSKSFIEFSKVNGSDLSGSIESTEKILKQFNEDTDQASNFLGMLTKKQQETGISTDTLMSSLEENSSTLKIMGLNLSSSTNLLAQFEKNGVDVSQALAGLKKSVSTYTDKGLSANEALKSTIDSIKNAKTETEAYQIAMDVFGKKGFQPMAVAIREGKINLDTLSDSLGNYSTVVNDTYQATLDPWDKLTVATNNLKEAGSDLAGTALNEIEPEIKDVTKLIKDATTWYGNLDSNTKKVVSVTALLTTGMGYAAPKVLKVVAAVKALEAANKITSASTDAQTAAQIAENTATTAGTGATMLLGDAMAALPLVGVIAGVSAAALAITALVDASKPAGKANADLKDEINATKSAFDDTKSSADETSGSYQSNMRNADDLAKTIEELNGKESLNAAEKLKLSDSVSQLNQLIPDLNLTIDDNTGKISGNTSETFKNIEAKKKQYEQDLKEQKRADLLKQISDLEIQQESAEASLKKARENSDASIKESTYALIDNSKVVKSASKNYDDITSALKDAQDQYDELTGNTKVLKDATTDEAASFDATNTSASQLLENLGQVTDATNTQTDATNALSESQSSQQEQAQMSILTSGQELDAFNNLSANEQQLAVDVTNAVATMQSSVESSIQSQCDWFGKLDDSGQTSAQSIIDSMQSQIDSVHNWEANLTTLSTYTDDAGNHIDSGLLQSLADLGPQGAAYVQALVDDGGASLDTLNSTWQSKVDMTSMTDQWGQDLTNGIGTISAGSSEAWNQLGSDLGLKTNESGQYVVQGLVNGMAAAKSQLDTSADDTANSLLNKLNSSLGVASPSTKTYTSGYFVGSGLSNGVSASSGMVSYTASELGSHAINAIANVANANATYGIGRNVSSGLANGILAGLPDVTAASQAVAAQAEIAAKARLAVNSPSKVFKKIGGSVIEGFVDGIVDGKSLVADTVSSTLGIGDSYMSPTVRTSDSPFSGSGFVGFAPGGTTYNLNVGNIKYNTDDYIESAIYNFVNTIVRKGRMNGG